MAGGGGICQFVFPVSELVLGAHHRVHLDLQVYILTRVYRDGHMLDSI